MQQILVEITEEQVEKLRPYLPNINELRKHNLQEFLCELDDVIVAELDEDYEDTDVSIMLQRLYDEIRIASHKKYN